jgi:SNF2 family DNA or RNA helicase
MSIRPYQQEIVSFICKHPRCLVFAGMGLGKTLATLTALDLLDIVEGNVFPALIVAPLRVAKSTWPDEVAKWPQFKHLRVSVVCGKPSERAAALRVPADIYITNYDNAVWLYEWIVAYRDGRTPFRTVIADESTRLKGFRTRQGGRRAKALAKIAKMARRFVGLTGTPTSQGLTDLYGQQWFVDFGKALGASYSAFQHRWFHPVKLGSDAFSVRWDAHDHSPAEITDRIRGTTISVDPKDHFDLKDPIDNIIKVDLPPAARTIYKQMAKDFFVELDSGTVEAFSAGAKSLKLVQIAAGFIYDNDGNWTEIHDAKLDALESIIEEAAGMPVLVSYHFKPDLERLQKRFPQGRVLDADPQTIRDWNSGKIPIMFAHPKSAGHGLSLQYGGNILAFYSRDWNLEEHLQIIERIGPVRQMQAGLNRNVFIHHIVAKGTIDELIAARVDDKKTVLETLLEALK